MSLRTLAESDLAVTLEDGVSGFGWPITLIAPSDLSAPLTGSSNDIAQAIDPDTGQIVSGRTASVALRIASILDAGFSELPRNVEAAGVKPWRVMFDDINGNSYMFKVRQTNPDRALGLLVCMLENYS